MGRRVRRDGQSYSVCETDFAPTLSAIAARLTALVSPPIDEHEAPPFIRIARRSAAVAALLAACSDRPLPADAAIGGTGNFGPGGAGGGTFTPTRKVDMLFVIDDSSEMRLEQDNLIRNFPTIMTTLQNSPAGLPDLRIAVVSTDMGAGDGSVASCDATGGKNGIFQYTARGTCTSTGLAPGATYISGQRRRPELHRQPR